MLESLNSLVDSMLGSQWAYLTIFLVVAVDAFFPAVPGEVVVVAAGVLAASGEQTLAWVVLAGAVGAFAGDHVSYAIGRVAGARAVGYLVRGSRGRAAHARVQRMFQARGGIAIVVLRFVSGGRTATTLAAGMLGYPLRRFWVFDSVAAVLWANYIALLGYWAGGVFDGRPLVATLAGLGFSIVVAAGLEITRSRIRRRRAGADAQSQRARE